MILIDKNNDPSKTVFYLAAVAYSYIKKCKNIGLVALFNKVIEETGINTPFKFFMLAVDFLFLIGKVEVNKRGDIFVPRKVEFDSNKIISKKSNK